MTNFIVSLIEETNFFDSESNPDEMIDSERTHAEGSGRK
jgi:hypothetical protein